MGKMEKVYWSENLGQFVTKGKKCLYDKNIQSSPKDPFLKGLLEETLKRISKLENAICNTDGRGILERQLQCAAKTQGKHNMVYYEQDHPATESYWFKCQICKLIINKTKKELSAVEKEGLKKLKLL